MGRRRKGRKGSRAVPLFGLLPVAVPLYQGYMAAGGLNKAFPKEYIRHQVGYNIDTNAFNTNQVGKVLGLAIVAVIGHKLATRVGASKAVKKATGGLLSM